MQINPTLALSLLLLPATVFAQEVDPQTALEEFTQQNGEGWQVEWNAATGTPHAIYGPGLKLGHAVSTLEGARADSEALLAKYSAMLRLGRSDLVEIIGQKVNQVYVFVYDQKYQGLDVISGRADVRIHDTGVVAMFGSAAVQIPANFNLNPAVRADFARTEADRRILGGPGRNQQAPRLVIWADADSKTPTTPILAWEVQIDEYPEPAVGKAYIDANTGNMIEFKNEVLGANRAPAATSNERVTTEVEPEISTNPATGAPVGTYKGVVQAWVNLGHNPTDALTLTPLKNVQVTASGGGSAFTDSAGNFTIANGSLLPNVVTATLAGRHSKRIRVAQGTQMSASALIANGGTGTITFGTSGMGIFDRAQTTTYWFTDDANTWLRSLVGNTTQMTSMSGMDPRVNIASSCNAFYTAFTINFYHLSATCNMTAYETVIQHEWGHGLDDAFGGISQVDGLSEGWGDIICTYRSRQPIVGPNFRLSGTPTYVRTALNTRTYPAGGGVHQQGETWMGFAWDLRTNLMATLGAAAGEARAISIVVKSIVADATNQPNAVREVFILDDDDGNLNNGTPNYNELEAAALKRRLPYPVRRAKVSLYYRFDSGRGTNVVNYGDGALRSTMVHGGTATNGPWQSPGKFGKSMLQGSSNASATHFNYCDTGFGGPLAGHLTIAWWMKERLNPGTGLSYLWGGLNGFRCFTNGVAGTGLWVRSWGGTPDIQYPGNIQTTARAAGGACIALTINAASRQAQWYLNGAKIGAAIALSGGVNVAAAATSFNIGKEISDIASSVYDLDEFRMMNRVATDAEIASWCQGGPTLYYKLDRGLENIAVNYGFQPAPSRVVNSGPGPWILPGKYGRAMLSGSSNSSATHFNYVDTGFRGPVQGDFSVHWWMKERFSPGTALSYVFGGIGNFRCFTNGVAGTGLWVRDWGGADLEFPGNLQTLARAAAGICVGLTVCSETKLAQWYVNGAAFGAAIPLTGGANVALSTSSFKIGKHTSDTNSSVYDIDEFRFDNRVATAAEIKLWHANATAGSGVYASSCGIALDSLGGPPRVGNANYAHSIAVTPAAATNCLFVIGLSRVPSFDMGIALPALAGCRWYARFDIQAVFPTGTDGRVVVPGGVPNTPSLAGLHLDIQVLGVQRGVLKQSNPVSHVVEIN